MITTLSAMRRGADTLATTIGAIVMIRSLASLAVGCLALCLSCPSHGEIVDLSRGALRDGATAIVVGTCVKVESQAERRGNMEHTTWSHRLKVESTTRDGDGAIKPGDEIVLLSWSDAWRGTGDPPPFGSGHRGMPNVGERRRVYIAGSIAQAAGERAKDHRDALRLSVMLPNGWQSPERSVVFVGADDEYRSEISMPLVADCFARDAKARTIVAFPADPTTHALDVTRRDHIEHLDALRDADVAVIFMRWRELDPSNWQVLAEFLSSGQPIVGLRTSTHMIRSAADAPNHGLDVDLPTRVFGQRWISHAGNDTQTRVVPPEGDLAKHPILRGIRGGFDVPGWLYDVEPLPPECTVLLWGEVVKHGVGNAERHRQPILWIREATASTPKPFADGGKAARRMAFTTLGHPGDFAQVEVRRLVEQMTLWAVGDEAAIPESGVKAEPSAPYAPPPTR